MPRNPSILLKTEYGTNQSNGKGNLLLLLESGKCPIKTTPVQLDCLVGKLSAAAQYEKGDQGSLNHRPQGLFKVR